MSDNTETRMSLEARMAYVHLEKPRKASEGAKEKYSVTALIPKDSPVLAQIKAATTAAKTKKFGPKPPSGLKACVRDGDEKDAETGEFLRKGDEFRGHFYITCSSDKPVPVVTGKDRTPAKPEHMCSGYYGVISLNFYGYDVSGSKGVAAGLNAVWITRKGEPLGNGDATEAFAGMKVAVDDFTASASAGADPFAGGAASEEDPF